MISSTVLCWLLVSASSQYLPQMLISITFDASRFLVSVSTRPAVLKVDFEGTVDTGRVNKSRTIMKSTRYPVGGFVKKSYKSLNFGPPTRKSSLGAGPGCGQARPRRGPCIPNPGTPRV